MEASTLSIEPLATGYSKKEASMDKCINFCGFMRQLIDEEKLVKQGAEIVKALLEAQSPQKLALPETPGTGSQMGNTFFKNLACL